MTNFIHWRKCTSMGTHRANLGVTGLLGNCQSSCKATPFPDPKQYNKWFYSNKMASERKESTALFVCVSRQSNQILYSTQILTLTSYIASSSNWFIQMLVVMVDGSCCNGGFFRLFIFGGKCVLVRTRSNNTSFSKLRMTVQGSTTTSNPVAFYLVTLPSSSRGSLYAQ